MANKNKREKNQIRKRIRQLAHEKLFRVQEGVKFWVGAFMDIATRPRKYHWRSEGIALRAEL